MKINQLGEFRLIERIRRSLPTPSSEVIAGIGDDVAVLRGQDERVWLATCDVLVEGSHFIRSAVSPRNLGRKALAVNLSDIAASGGDPRFALVSLGLPNDLEVEYVDELYGGLREEAGRYKVEIVGGNISSSKLGLFVDIFLLGTAAPGDVMLRSGARPGDRVLVTGTLGDAAAGVALLLDQKLWTDASYAAVAAGRRNAPTPRVREGKVIATSHMATAMMDISDGLAGDLDHICEQSKVGARVFAENLPVATENRFLAQLAHGDEWHFALHGGEDYELLFTAPSEQASELAQRITRETGTSVSVIGEIVPRESARELVLPGGRIIPLEVRGWDHLRRDEVKGE